MIFSFKVRYCTSQSGLHAALKFSYVTEQLTTSEFDYLVFVRFVQSGPAEIRPTQRKSYAA